MPEPREWHELADDVLELRPTKRGGRRYLICNADVEDWWWCGGEDQALREDIDVAHALCRERAVQWLASEHRVYIVDLGCKWYQAMEVFPDGDKPVMERVPGVFGTDFDVCTRRAVDAARTNTERGD
jgi:hypothetical protein